MGSVPEALPLIRADLGKDAVILSTKEIKTGGVLGMFAKRRVEVLAAVESGAAAAGATVPQPNRPAPLSRPHRS